MSDDDKQTDDKHTVVDETNEQAKPDSAGPDARTDDDSELEKLVDQYRREAANTGQQHERQASDQTSEQKPKNDDPLAEVNKLRQEIQQERIEAEVKNLLKTVQGEKNVPERVMEGWIDQIAKADPWLADKYFRGGEEGRQVAMRHLKKSFERDFKEWGAGSKVDEDATADRAAVSAAVRGASTKAPAERPPAFGRMADGERRKYVEENYGYTPRA